MPPKRNVDWIKPDEPAFLKRMKAAIGYQETEDLVDAKRGPIGDESDEYDSDELHEKDDEKPQVVQLREGDLTAEEAAKIEKDEAEKPADLTQRVIFKAGKRKKDESAEKKDQSAGAEKKDDVKSSKTSKDKGKPSKSLLSFDDEEDEEG